MKEKFKSKVERVELQDLRKTVSENKKASQSKSDDMENRSRRQNLLFHGIPEN